MNTLPETDGGMTAAATPGRPGPGRRAHILVVDDDPYTCELNAGVLIRSGYEVDTAEDGVNAWRALRQTHYDLLITEHHMPWVTGLELIQKLRADAMTLPVILAVEANPGAELNRPPGLRIEAVVPQPCPLERLLETVQAVLRNALDPALVEVVRTADRERLLDLRRRLGGKENLDAVEKAELEQAMDERFCVLNEEAVGSQKARWILGGNSD